MNPIHLLAISRPGAAYLSLLDNIAQPVHICIAQDPETAIREAPNAQVILLANFKTEPFRSVLPLAKRLEWVHTLAAGVDPILFPEFVSSPVPLTNGQGVFSEALAEFTIASMLFFAKDLRRMLRSQDAGAWDPFDIAMLSGATLGIVGYGAIGRASARLSHRLGMRVLAMRKQTARSQDDPHIEAVYAPDRLREMLARCDFVLVAAPLTPETRGMIGAAELSAMKKSAVMINVGRGAVIVESALTEALEQNRLRGAALDVFEQEPLPAGHPFYRMHNVLLSPHCADRSPGSLHTAMQPFLENFERYRHGRPLTNVVDKKAGY